MKLESDGEDVWEGEGDVVMSKKALGEEEEKGGREKRVLSSLRLSVPSFASLGLACICGGFGWVRFSIWYSDYWKSFFTIPASSPLEARRKVLFTLSWLSLCLLPVSLWSVTLTAFLCETSPGIR